MDNLSQSKLIRAQFVLLSVEGKNIMIKRSTQSAWKVYMHCFSRENATEKCDDLVKRNSNYIKL